MDGDMQNCSDTHFAIISASCKCDNMHNLAVMLFNYSKHRSFGVHTYAVWPTRPHSTLVRSPSPPLQDERHSRPSGEQSACAMHSGGLPSTHLLLTRAVRRSTHLSASILHIYTENNNLLCSRFTVATLSMMRVSYRMGDAGCRPSLRIHTRWFVQINNILCNTACRPQKSARSCACLTGEVVLSPLFATGHRRSLSPAPGKSPAVCKGVRLLINHGLPRSTPSMNMCMHGS